MVFPTFDLEKKLLGKGYKYIAGLDEAGRGPLAGPVVAGCVSISNQKQIVDIVRDSKKMTEKQRNEAYDLIINRSDGYGVGIVDSKTIDNIGIKWAVLKAMEEAVEHTERMLGNRLDYIIADGGIYLLDGYSMESINHGDLNHYLIAAGSVLAKVTRDRIMYEYAQKYPQYGFEKHVGYGTKYHMDMLRKYGACEIHRRSFAPVKAICVDQL
jgi:ribonuclease HII